jgi:hypothetical protein
VITLKRLGPLLAYLLFNAAVAYAFARLAGRYPPMP